MIATCCSQSRRLLECGVDPETADMIETRLGNLLNRTQDFPVDETKETLVWSLSALLGLLPKEIKVDESPYDEVQKYGLLIYPFMSGWQIDYQYCIYDECHNLMCIYSTDIIEVCVQAIEWLNANNYKLNRL
ncbi:hypothetical protein E4T81_12410 [Barnesiella sp. WM24]|uniref:hypothetical protein n=1 Tax=Barnesiella sp. WM24 TaxID=2558278 RepID=UPI001072E7C0|nr:hypothetical protein [Barnesiella sp. WM24]TFU92385.1 hypothetical protein E4T81_12410 [Barnesiella sp. WM24]